MGHHTLNIVAPNQMRVQYPPPPPPPMTHPPCIHISYPHPGHVVLYCPDDDQHYEPSQGDLCDGPVCVPWDAVHMLQADVRQTNLIKELNKILLLE